MWYASQHAAFVIVLTVETEGNDRPFLKFNKIVYESAVLTIIAMYEVVTMGKEQRALGAYKY